MEVKFNLQGSKRKEMAQVIGRWLGYEVSYKGAPGFAYEIGRCSIDRNGVLKIDDSLNDETTERLLQHLYDEGFESDIAAFTGLCVSMPRSLIDETGLENLKVIVSNKAELLKKAFDTQNLNIEVTEEKVCFPWFKTDCSPDEVNTYDTFICKLFDFAKTQKRMNKTEKTVVNEKYAFRCFLLRLGFIGDDYKVARKILLRNLEGNTAFKNKPSEATDNA